MKKIVALMMAALTALVMLCGCSEAEKPVITLPSRQIILKASAKLPFTTHEQTRL